jgi:hypothetical protein
MTDKDPIAPPAEEASRRHWDAPHVRRMAATSAEIGPSGSTDNTEQLS